eukprot:CAMPEP_0116873950 /NCGR_PEP_ID=MMETSP0463-20121206/5303_1 /TAXON_ID=181622 /ORGANISM="Strombidinopsis sp, Strain SopsisLIS2011" /LENGTH=36 /DNA_ID= /DNA_START= /DNA_END= /DNA_ORIENTATION=
MSNMCYGITTYEKYHDKKVKTTALDKLLVTMGDEEK